MGLFDKVKSIAQPSLREIADNRVPEIASQMLSQLEPLLNRAVHVVDDDSKYLSYVATPLFRVLPPMIQVLGRERLKWDPIMFDLRDHVLRRSGAEVTVRADALPIVVAILRKHFTGQQSALLDSPRADPSTSGQTAQDATTRALALYQEGKHLWESGHPREGLMKLCDAVEVDPRCVDARLGLAGLFYELDPIKHAEAIFAHVQAIQAVHPHHAGAINIASVTHFAHGKAAWDAKDWPAATRSFLAAYTFAPDAEHAAEAVAYCAEQGGILPDAIDAFEKRLVQKPDDARARYLAGRSLVKVAMSEATGGNLEKSHQYFLKALPHLEAITSANPGHAEALYFLGAAYRMSGMFDQAKVIVDRLRVVDEGRCAKLVELVS